MYNHFYIAAGTIPGRHHVGTGNLLGGKNNQDAYGAVANKQAAVGIVFDGCSASKHSEVGAKLAAQLMPGLVLTSAARVDYAPDAMASVEFWREVQAQALSRFEAIFQHLAPHSLARDEMIAEHFLFTIVGVIVTDQCSIFFSIGDGAYAVDDELKTIGPYAQNAPPYLCYELINAYRGAAISFTINQCVLDTVGCVAVATDGLLHLIDKEDVRLPGKQTRVGTLSQLWSGFPNCETSDSDTSIQESITPWLRMANSEVVLLGEQDGTAFLRRHYGLLSDDTTILAIRRKRGA